MMGVLSILNLLIDWLHTVDSGVSQYCGGAIFGLLVEANAYNVAGHLQEQRERESVRRIRENLVAWYEANPHVLTKERINRVTASVLYGSNLKRPNIHGKAMESRCLFLLVTILKNHCQA